jgi:hypothetical protein
MPRNFIIGIGGTGARCVESVMHLCAAGLGPTDLWVGFIDQDSNNGNLNGASDVLLKLGALNSQLREDVEERAAHLSLLHTELWAGTSPASQVTGDTSFRWRPAPRDEDTFAGVFAYDAPDPEAQSLMQALYYRGPEGLRPERSEHRMPLKKGFHGRPGLGAAVLLNKANNLDDPFWQALRTCVRPSAGQVSTDPVRIMLVGSVFGGTGAGGLPILARFLRSMADAQENGWRLRLSALLMGPYFKYTQPDTDLSLSADPDNFPAKLRDAFQYYATLLETPTTFDRVYLGGWHDLIDFRGDAKTDRTGGPDQRNPATLPELYAGLAATHFFNEPETAFDEIHDRNRPCGVFATSILGDEITDNLDRQTRQRSLTWADLPGDPAAIRKALGRHIRFCHVYHSFFHHVLHEDLLRQGIRLERWYQRLARSAMEEQRTRDPKQTLATLDAYCQHVLTWWGGIDQLLAPGDLPRALIDSGAFARAEVINNYTQIVLKPNVEDTDSWNRFTYMVKGDEARELALDDIFRALNNARPNTNTHGIGRFIGGLYDACDA